MLISKIASRNLPSFFPAVHTQIDTSSPRIVEKNADKFLVMKDVILPNVKQAFATGFINNFTSAMVTAGAVIFLVTPGQKIAVFTLFDCINTGRYGEASMIATFIIVITISVNVLFSIIVAWKGKKKRVFRTEKHK